MTPFAFSGILAAASSFGFGLLVLLKGQDRKLRRIWFLFTLSVAAWECGAIVLGSAKTAHGAVLSEQWGYAFGVIWIASIFYQFVCTFLELNNKKSILFNYSISGLFLITVPTPFFFKPGPLRWNSIYFPGSGKFHMAFFVWWMGLVIYSHVLLLRAYPTLSAVKKNQIKYFFLATAIGFFGGSLCYLPNFGINLYPWGNFAVVIYPYIMFIAIAKHHLMDVTVIIRKTLLYSVVSAALASIYVGTITILAHVLGRRYSSVSAFSSALAAIVITLLFNPLRMKIQRFIDRHFFRESLDQAILREATSGFVHEIKRPLANISLPAELSLMDLRDVSEGRRSSIEILPKVIQRLEYILHQTTDAGNKIEAIREVSSPNGNHSEPVNVAAIIQSILSAEKTFLEKHGVKVKLDITADLPMIRGHAKQLEIAINNLVKNSVEAMAQMPEGQPRVISIQSSVDSGQLKIEVKDTGPGIKTDHLPRLFEPYFTTKGTKGMGMGLFLCRQIVQGHGGTIQVKSDARHGAIFHIELPHG